jgi:hypothetical protein
MAKETSPEAPTPELQKMLLQSKRKLMLTVTFAAIACAVITIIVQPMDGSALVLNAVSVSASGSAFLMSVGVIIRQKFTGILPRMYVSLGIALGLWFAAEAIWAYYEAGLGIETPFPSLADAFWLSGYVPFFYFMYGIVKYFAGTSKATYLPILLTTSIGFVLVANILYSIYLSADLTGQDGVISYVVASAYPVADMLLIIPAVAAFSRFREGRLTFTPWMLIVLANIVFIIGDIGFAYSTSFESLSDFVWVWNPLYNLGDIAIASALFWHRSFFTVDERKLLRLWQERNK